MNNRVAALARPDPAPTPAQEFARLYTLTPEGAVRYLEGRDETAVTYDWRDMLEAEHAEKFTISRLTRADILKSIQDGITASVEGDLSRRDWTKSAAQLLAKEGWWGEVTQIDPATGEAVTTRFDKARLKLIFDTNTRVAYSAGQWERVQDAKATHPYLRYITRADERVRASHAAWNGVTLPVDDPFWNTHWPPNGWRCRCRVQSMTRREYDRAKADGTIRTAAPPGKTREWINPRSGKVRQVPVGIDPGWDYNPGVAGARAAKLRQTTHDKLDALPPSLAHAARAARLESGIPEGFSGPRPGLADLPPVPVVTLTGREFGAGLNKPQLAQAADALLRAIQKSPGLINDDTGWLFRVNQKGRKKMGDNADLSAAESKAVAGIERLVQNAIVAERHADIEHGNPDVAAVLRLYVPVDIAGVMYRAKLTVKDYKTAGEPKRLLHALAAIEIESAPLGTLPSYSGAKALQTAQPTAGRTLSIASLLAGATLQDGTPILPGAAAD